MRIRQVFTAFTLAGVCLMMGACIDSKEPLSSPEKAKVDAKLLGTWQKIEDNGNAAYYHIGRAGDKLPPGVLRGIIATHLKDGTLMRPGEILLFSTEIGEHRFLNVAVIAQEDLGKFEKSGWNADLAKGYFVAKYKVRGDSLSLWGLDRDAKRKAIESGKIKGTVEENSVTFTDAPEKVAALLASPDGADLFAKEPTVYQRVK